MNVQIQGVYVYGGDSTHRSVFRGQEKRARRRRIGRMIAVALPILALIIFFFA